MGYVDFRAMRIGISRERKNPPDNRVAFTPIQCVALKSRYPQLSISVEASPNRCFSDEQYREVGVEVVDSLSHCDVIFNIKEIPPQYLIPEKTYFFFSHTIKKQPYNQAMLQEIINQHITLIDYEVLRWESGQRVLGFGRYAGVVGAYNGLLVYGKKYNLWHLKPAYQCANYAEMLTQAMLIKLPPLRIVITGGGRVAQGALDMLRALKIREISPKQFLHIQYTEPVFVQLNSPDLYVHPTLKEWDTQHFYNHHHEYHSQFLPYASSTDLLINGVYWTQDLPRLFEKSDTAAGRDFPTVIADVSCDINGSVPITFDATTIAEPVIGWNRKSQEPCSPYSDNSIDIMAVGNLPNELPKDASEEFGEMLMQHIIPALLQTHSKLIEQATIAKEGKLTADFRYLSDYVQDSL